MFTIKRSANVAKIQKFLNALPAAQKQVIRKTYYDIGKDLVADARKEINKKPKSGRFYEKPESGASKDRRGMLAMAGYGNYAPRRRMYQASAPGEAPAKVTGALYDSIDFNVNGWQQMSFGVDQAREGVNYAAFLEYANLVSMTGQGSPKIKPRPFLSAAYASNKVKIKQKFANAIDRILKI
jgi:hypothetical protein